MIPKHWIYHVWDAEYNYLGTIKNVKSDFVLTLDINSAGPSPINIDVSLNADTAQLPVKILTTEDGKYITTEDGKYITTEGEATNYGVRGTQIFNGNIVQVVEVSNYHPTGKIVYSGRIKRWRKRSRNNLMTLFVTPLSYDVNNHIVKSFEVLHDSQTNYNDSYAVYGGETTAGRKIAYAMNKSNVPDNISKITLTLSGQSATPTTATLRVFKLNNATGATLDLNRMNDLNNQIGSATVTVSSTSVLEYDLTLTVPANTAASVDYGISVESAGVAGNGVNVHVYTTDVKSGLIVSTEGTSTWRFGYGSAGASGGLYGDFYFKMYTIPPYTKFTLTNFVASTMLKTIMNNYISEGGLVTYDAADIGNTGDTIPSYTFSVTTVKEGMDAMLDFAAKDWYYTIDPGLNTLVFKQANTTTADHVFTYKKEIGDIELVASIERVKNAVYFTGGDTGGTNLFILEENQESINSFGVEIDRITDIRVTNSGTGTAKAQKHLNRNDDEAFETEIEIYDGVVDITEYLPGQTIGFQGYDSFIDSLILPIVRVTRYGEKVILSLGVLPYRESSAVQQLQDTVLSIQTIDNPTSPS